jgi:ubiquinol-cytochrome c reductase cytochrome b subunit
MKRIGLWLDDRFGFSALAYPIPRHANSLAYTLGGITLGSFVLLVATGIYLTQFYDPTPAGAHASVVHLSGEPTGAIIRSLHFWLSGIFISTLLLHLLRTFVTAAYKRPREGVWLTGIVLFLLAGGLLFTGTMLKWDQEAFEAYGHNIEIAKLLGAFGFVFSAEFSDTVSLLTRTYITHISILPLLLAALVGIHLLLVKKQRIAPLPWGTAEEVERRERDEEALPFTTHLVRIAYWTLAVLGLALVLTALRPVGIGPEGVEGIEITKPPWYFLWLYPFENWFGLKALVVLPGLLVAGLAAIPFLDRGPERDPRRRRPWIALAALVLVAWAALTVYAFLSVPVSHVGQM